jgi:bifunctional non-homologous end joining protein LigD
MDPLLVDVLPKGRKWIYEIKWDGYRGQLIRNGAAVRLISRNGKDLTRDYPSIVEAARRMKVQQATLDGEIIGLDDEGLPSFQALQHRARDQANILYVAYDLLNENGEDLRSLPLYRRRARLQRLIKGTGIQFSEPIDDEPEEALQFVRERHLEGVVAKPRDSTYDARKSGCWLKFRVGKQQEFVVGGFRPNGRAVDALFVGYFENSELHFAGKVRNGFTLYARREWFLRLNPIATRRCPFVEIPISRSSRWDSGITAEELRSVRWVESRFVVQIRYREWTTEGRLRHAYYLGIREDKDASDVRREAVHSVGSRPARPP